MKTIKVKIEGTGEGLLMHSPKAMTQPTVTKNPTKQYDQKADAEKVAYRNGKKELIIPRRCLKAAILNASSWHKFGKISAKQVIAGCTTLEPPEIVITNKKGKILKDYEIDVRSVVIQKARIMRARPLIKDWCISFEIIYNEELIADTKIIRKILEEAGQRIGLLDNRPHKFGDNGTFKIKSFEAK